MKKDILKTIIRDFHAGKLPPLHRRDLELRVGSGKIVSLVGARRAGKTSCLFNVVESLLAQGVERNRILYVNFEDERLTLEARELDELLQAYLELYPGLDLRECHFLLDEIQNVDGWDRFVRRAHDSVTKNIFVTGSNARLLSREIATALRGRTVSVEVFPLSFREYLRFKGVEADVHGTKSAAQVNHHLAQYLRQGGFPEVIGYDDAFRNKVLQEYFNVMMYRDLVERYRIANLPALKYFLKKVVASATKPFSVNKLYNDLKSSGIRIGKNQLYEFLEACQDVFLAFVLKKHGFPVPVRELGEKKIYCIDTGLLNAVDFRFSEDAGKAMEQVVFLALRRRGMEVFFFKGKTECDFLVRDEGRETQALQVTYSLSDEGTARREVNGLVEACTACGLASGTIVSHDPPQELVRSGVRIRVVPLARWLLEGG